MTEQHFNFKQFTLRRVHNEQNAVLSIQRRANASLNRVGQEMLGNPPAVDLFFDEDQRVLGLKPGARESPSAYPLRRVSGGGSTAILSLASLLNYYGVSLERARGRYIGSMYGDMLIFNLDERVGPEDEDEDA